MKVYRNHRASPRNSFIIEFIWFSLAYCLAALLGCYPEMGRFLDSPDAGRAVDYAEARAEAHKDPEVIEADRAYKQALRELAKAHHKLQQIAGKTDPAPDFVKGFQPENPPPEPKKFSKPADKEAWEKWTKIWWKRRRKADRLLSEWDYLADQKAKQRLSEEKTTWKRLDAQSGGSGSGSSGDCFTADTWVLMANNRFKQIIDLEIGARVQTFDIGAGKVVPKPVTDLYYAFQDHYYLINGRLKVTANHPFFTAEGRWKKTRELAVGDRIFSDREPIKILSIKRIKLNHIVYNFRVADSHNYFVSPDGEDLYLVHNCK